MNLAGSGILDVPYRHPPWDSRPEVSRPPQLPEQIPDPRLGKSLSPERFMERNVMPAGNSVLKEVSFSWFYQLNETYNCDQGFHLGGLLVIANQCSMTRY